jgi:hypothetical protein
MAKQVHVSLDEIEEYFESLEDPRSEINQKHPFVSVAADGSMKSSGYF